MRVPTFVFGLISLVAAVPQVPKPGHGTNSTAVCVQSLRDFTNCSPSATTNDKQCPHHYTFSEFAPHVGLGATRSSNRQHYFHFMIMFKMNPALCEAQAYEHWKTVHADLTLASKDTGVLIERYTQFHADSAGRAAIQSLVDTGAVVSDFNVFTSRKLLRSHRTSHRTTPSQISTPRTRRACSSSSPTRSEILSSSRTSSTLWIIT